MPDVQPTAEELLKAKQRRDHFTYKEGDLEEVEDEE